MRSPLALQRRRGRISAVVTAGPEPCEQLAERKRLHPSTRCARRVYPDAALEVRDGWHGTVQIYISEFRSEQGGGNDLLPQDRISHMPSTTPRYFCFVRYLHPLFARSIKSRERPAPPFHAHEPQIASAYDADVAALPGGGCPRSSRPTRRRVRALRRAAPIPSIRTAHTAYTHVAAM